MTCQPVVIAVAPISIFDLFEGSKMVQCDWLLASQSGCCRFDPFWLKCEKNGVLPYQEKR